MPSPDYQTHNEILNETMNPYYFLHTENELLHYGPFILFYLEASFNLLATFIYLYKFSPKNGLSVGSFGAQVLVCEYLLPSP